MSGPANEKVQRTAVRSALGHLATAKEAVRRGWAILFYDPKGQVFALFIGLFVVATGVCLSWVSTSIKPQEGIMAALIGIGGSIIASAMVVKILGREDKPLIADTGVAFVGSRSSYEARCRPGTSASAWDDWIRRTPRGGELIVVGKKNFQWVDKSWLSVTKVLQKNAEIRFVFMGETDAAADENIERFVKRAQQIDASSLSHEHLSFYRYIPHATGESPRSLADTGYYWNGYDLMVKVYVQNGENYNCPLIVFTPPGVSHRFSDDDFDPSTIPLSHADSLIEVARALGSVLEGSVRIARERILAISNAPVSSQPKPPTSGSE